MDKSTKYYSSRQERMIADYLGWSVVSGSGARAFNPGDVRSADFLGECKTFTEPSDTIFCYHRVWTKICDEATSIMRCPVLFVDNGTQLARNTWCVVPQTIVDTIPNMYIFDKSIAESALRISKTRISFSHTIMRLRFNLGQYDDVRFAALPFTLANQPVSLILLGTLKYIISTP